MSASTAAAIAGIQRSIQFLWAALIFNGTTIAFNLLMFATQPADAYLSTPRVIASLGSAGVFAITAYAILYSKRQIRRIKEQSTDDESNP